MEDFIPSLSGYVQSLPAITTLRLCNRYGKGSSCFVNRLPTELVDLIEGYIHLTSRQSAFAEWEQQKNCTLRRCGCECSEHYHNPAVPRRLLRRARSASSMPNSTGREDGRSQTSGMPSAAARNTDIEVHLKSHDNCSHPKNVSAFVLRTRDCRAVDTDAKNIKKHFGLDVWTPIRHSYDVHPDDIRLRPLATGLRHFDVDRYGMALPDKHPRQPQLLVMLPGSITCIDSHQNRPEKQRLEENFMTQPCPDRGTMRRFLHVCRMLELRSSEDLHYLETLANIVGRETNAELRTQLHAGVIECDDKFLDLEEWHGMHPDIVNVQRPSSWESRMQTAWLKGNSP